MIKMKNKKEIEDKKPRKFLEKAKYPFMKRQHWFTKSSDEYRQMPEITGFSKDFERQIYGHFLHLIKCEDFFGNPNQIS